jgi:twitching motility protein PilT
MRDGKIDGMQEFDFVLKEMIERQTITLEDGLAFATNPNNLVLALKGMSAAEEFASVASPQHTPAAKRRAAGSLAPPARPASPPSMLDMID